MRQNLKYLLALCTLSVLVGANIASAGLSLGSAQLSSSASVTAGDSVTFKLLLFNAHERDGLEIETAHEEPVGWSVSVNPSAFSLPYTEIGDRVYDPDYEFLGTGAGDVKAKPVWVNVLVPPDEKDGNYRIKVMVFATGSGGMVAMSQSASYVFTVDVKAAEASNPPQEEENAEGGGGASPHEETAVQETVTPEETRNLSGKVSVEETNKLRSQVEEQIGDLTGMLISNPMITPLALIIPLLIFVVLKVLKKI